MNRSVRFLSAATDDISETKTWYDAQRFGLGEEFVGRLNDTLDQIQSRPLSFPAVAGDARRAVLKRFPYCVYFIVREADLVVLAVLHGSRNPAVWQRRAIE